MNSETEKNKRSARLSSLQKQTLIDYLRENEQLVSGKFTNQFTFKEAATQWQQVAATLNAIPGARKDWRQWKKVWQDLKKCTKHKSANMKKYVRVTGGGEASQEVLTPAEEGILGILGATAVEGHDDVAESPASFVEDDVESESVSEQQKLEAPAPPPVVAAGSPAPPPTIKRKRSDRKRTVVAQRLLNTIQATEQLVLTAEKKTDLKRWYYEKKIELLEKQVAVQQEHWQVSKDISNTLQELIKKM